MNEELSLEQLENDYWGQPEYNSRLVLTCHALRKKPVKDLSIEDVRILLGRNIGLTHLIPKAIDLLHENILAEGDLFEGDLLQNVLSSDPKYWQDHEENWETMCQLFNKNEDLLNEFDTIDEIKNRWFESFSRFESLVA